MNISYILLDITITQDELIVDSAPTAVRSDFSVDVFVTHED
jgi:hypothetical protein